MVAYQHMCQNLTGIWMTGFFCTEGWYHALKDSCIRLVYIQYKVYTQWGSSLHDHDHVLSIIWGVANDLTFSQRFSLLSEHSTSLMETISSGTRSRTECKINQAVSATWTITVSLSVYGLLVKVLRSKNINAITKNFPLPSSWIQNANHGLVSASYAEEATWKPYHREPKASLSDPKCIALHSLGSGKWGREGRRVVWVAYGLHIPLPRLAPWRGHSSLAFTGESTAWPDSWCFPASDKIDVCLL